MSLLEANLAAGGRALRLMVPERAPGATRISFTASRDGLPNIAVERAGRLQSLHSSYAAGEEARRLASDAAAGRVTVVLGLGLAHHVLEILRRGGRAVVIEPDAELLTACLERVDLSSHLVSGRLSIGRASDGHDLRRTLERCFVPGIDSGMDLVVLPGRQSADPDLLVRLRSLVASAFDEIQTDLAVQRVFARRWVRNTLLNLPRAVPARLPQWHGRTVLVAAAGPSLADQMGELRSAWPGAPLVAVDTALPVLLARGIRPDLAVSIDCQAVTYHHYLTASFPPVPLIVDLSLAPSLYDALPVATAALSAHPLHRLIRMLMPAYAEIDVSGGNVAHTAVALAAASGAREVRLYGADFSYPAGESYPRGSYLHAHFDSRATRLAGSELSHFAFLRDRPGVSSDPDLPGRLVHPALTRYRTRLEQLARTLSARVTACPGRGVRITDVTVARLPVPVPEPPPGRDPEPDRPADRTLRPDSARQSEQVLSRLRGLIESVAAPDFRGLAASDPGLSGQAARSLLPTIVALRAQTPDDDPQTLVERAKAEFLALLEP